MYHTPHDARRFGWGHHLRVEATITLGKWMYSDPQLRRHPAKPCSSLADLSCGNAQIPRSIALPGHTAFLGDYAPGYRFHGPLEETISQLPKDVDLFICSETIEHLDDPESVLMAIAGKAHMLLLSTPIGEDDLGNPEHLWGWDQEAVGEMLADTGWGKVLARVDLVLPGTYSYQIWGCAHG